MGIHGIYKEIGSGVRIALSKLAVQKFEETGRPLRLAIDTSIWLFQIQSSKGGTNPALRTFYYRLLRLMSLSIHPLFVFDGPNRPEFKRNKRVGGGKAQVASIPEFLAKQLLKQFGFPYHAAPGEAEAECALLQREGIVDAVLSEDVDTLMFGSGTTIRNWSPPLGSKSKTPTHVNLYDSSDVKASSGLDREGMILVAMMSGGDYITEGIRDVGPKLACEAARAGFGRDLCSISKSDSNALGAWKERLQHELKTNESKYFRTKHTAINIPEEFPNMSVLAYYTNPVVSSSEKLARLRQSLCWDMAIDYDALRAFTGDAFGWTNLGGAKHFIRNLATPLLVRELRMRGERPEADAVLTSAEEEENKLVHSLHGRRAHVSTDQTSEMRVAFRPVDLVPIDLDSEEPDEEVPLDDDLDDEVAAEDLDSTQPPSTARAPTKYDPTTLEKVWVLETFVRVGAPLKVQDWEAAFRDPRKYLQQKHANKAAAKPRRKVTKTSGMQAGALDRFTRISKPGLKPPSPEKASGPSFSETSQQPAILSLLSSSPPVPRQEALAVTELPPTVTKRRRRSPLRRAQTSPASLYRPTTETVTSKTVTELDLTCGLSTSASPSQALPQKKIKTAQDVLPKASNPQSKLAKEPITLSSSPPRTIDAWIRRSQSATPRKAAAMNVTLEPLAPVDEGSPSKSSRLEVRTVRIDDALRSARNVVPQLDLTEIDLPKSKRQYPQAHSHLTPADVAKMGTSVYKDDSQVRRRWDKWAPLTETSGNQPPIRRDQTLRDTIPTCANVTEILPGKPQEKLFVQIDDLADGFWQEVPASRLRNSSTGWPRRKKRPEVVVLALEDVKMLDLTTKL